MTKALGNDQNVAERQLCMTKENKRWMKCYRFLNCLICQVWRRRWVWASQGVLPPGCGSTYSTTTRYQVYIVVMMGVRVFHGVHSTQASTTLGVVKNSRRYNFSRIVRLKKGTIFSHIVRLKKVAYFIVYTHIVHIVLILSFPRVSVHGYASGSHSHLYLNSCGKLQY